MPAPSYTAEQREAADHARRQQVEELHELLAERIGSLDNTAEWEAYLRFAASFTQYSFLNRVAIWSQREGASAVGSYRSWLARGYQVRRGETAIRILAPITRRVPVLDTAGNPVLDADGRPREKREMISVKAIPVFDIGQCDGPPPPEAPVPVMPTGQAPPGLWDSLAQLVAEHGYRLERGDCGIANGITSYTGRTVRVRDDLDDAGAVRVLAHEAAHVLLEAPPTAEGIADCRGLREVEAESVSFLVVRTHGLDTSQYTFRYVTGWAHQTAGGDLAPEQIVRATGQRVIDTADTILAQTKPPPSASDLALDALEADVDRTLATPRGWPKSASAVSPAGRESASRARDRRYEQGVGVGR